MKTSDPTNNEIRNLPVNRYSKENQIVADAQKFLVIHIGHRGAGFFAYVLWVINQIRYCEKHGLYPLIWIDNSFENRFFDKQIGPNMWDYYFEPIAPVTYADILERIADPQDSLDKSKLLKLSKKEIKYLSHFDKESIYHWTYGIWQDEIPEDINSWYERQRRLGRHYVNRYVRVKKHIKKPVDDFVRKHFHGQRVLGVHIRGTDFAYAPAIQPAVYFREIDNWISNYPDLKIFLATDQEQYLGIFRTRYPGKILNSNSFRATGNVAPFNVDALSPYKRGEDVLIDCLLLSRCDFFIRGNSAVCEFAMYFNPKLCCLHLGTHKQHKVRVPAWDQYTQNPS